MPRRPARPTTPRCPCGGPAAYDDCCGRFHTGRALPGTAQELMRARYAAFAVRDAAYLLATWHPADRPERLALEPGLRWTGLQVGATTGGGLLDAEGTVAFTAHWRDGGRTGAQTEVSRFVRVGGRWTYAGPSAGPSAGWAR